VSSRSKLIPPGPSPPPPVRARVAHRLRTPSLISLFSSSLSNPILFFLYLGEGRAFCLGRFFPVRAEYLLSWTWIAPLFFFCRRGCGVLLFSASLRYDEQVALSGFVPWMLPTIFFFYASVWLLFQCFFQPGNFFFGLGAAPEAVFGVWVNFCKTLPEKSYLPIMVQSSTRFDVHLLAFSRCRTKPSASQSFSLRTPLHFLARLLVFFPAGVSSSFP